MESTSAQALTLASELLDDIELSRLAVVALVQKASRLARLVGDEEIHAWLSMEIGTYVNNDLGRRYMTTTGRWIDQESDKGWWGGVGQLEASLTAQESLLSTLQLPNLSGDMLIPALQGARTHAATVANVIATLGGIRAKVVGMVHQFVTTRYYELVFASKQENLLESARAQVDALLSPLSGETLAKIESIYRRLDEGDAEATSQALSTCRRLIDAVADAIYPPTDQTVELGGNTLNLTKQNVQNRLNVFVSDQTQSSSRRKRLRRTLSDLYDRVSTGVHSDVTLVEARFLFLNAYLTLGEILSLAHDKGE